MHLWTSRLTLLNTICGEMISPLTSSAVDRGLDSWSDQTKDLVSVFTSSAVDRGFDRVKSNTLTYVCVASPLSMLH